MRLHNHRPTEATRKPCHTMIKPTTGQVDTLITFRSTEFPNGFTGWAGGALMLVDANLLLYAVDRKSPFHTGAAEWLTEQLNGPRRVGLPWQSLVAFVRISTHPRASAAPLDPGEALRHVQDWLAPDVAWTPRRVRATEPCWPTSSTATNCAATWSATPTWLRWHSNMG